MAATDAASVAYAGRSLCMDSDTGARPGRPHRFGRRALRHSAAARRARPKSGRDPAPGSRRSSWSWRRQFSERLLGHPERLGELARRAAGAAAPAPHGGTHPDMEAGSSARTPSFRALTGESSQVSGKPGELHGSSPTLRPTGARDGGSVADGWSLGVIAAISESRSNICRALPITEAHPTIWDWDQSNVDTHPADAR